MSIYIILKHPPKTFGGFFCAFIHKSSKQIPSFSYLFNLFLGKQHLQINNQSTKQ